jgi:hypothetical protein
MLNWKEGALYMALSFFVRERALSLELLISLKKKLRLLVTANVVPSSLVLVTLMMEALSSSEMSTLTRTTRRKIPEDGILYSHRRENLKFFKTIVLYILNFGFLHLISNVLRMKKCDIKWH